MQTSRLAMAVAVGAALAATALEAQGQDEDLTLGFTTKNLIVSSDERPAVTFTGRAEPRHGERYWITVVKTGSADTEWGDWQYVDDGAMEAALEPQKEGGSYEIRLHARYPTERTHIICRARIMIEPSRVTRGINDLRAGFVTAKPNWAAGEALEVKFNAPLAPRPGEHYWMTVVKAGTPDTEPGSRQYVGEGATEATLRAPSTSGAHEIRLHARYPTEATHVICRSMVMIAVSHVPVRDNDLESTWAPTKRLWWTNETRDVIFDRPRVRTGHGRMPTAQPGNSGWRTGAPLK